jgi:hypothetical protein
VSARKQKAAKPKHIKVRVWSVLLSGGKMGWTVERFYDLEAANRVASLLRELSARRVFGQAGDVEVQRLDSVERITPEDYAARAASGARFEVVE